MTVTFKFKRGTGSDPSASDMVVGEPVLRTDTAELFFKKDDNSVAKVSGGGGGPDFKYLALRNAANNGAASYPGNDFTLVTSGTTNAITPAAANTLLVSYGGVIQKPNSGTSTSGITGFIVDGSRIKTATNFAAAPDFILYQESGGIGEPSDGTVTEAKLSVSNNPTNGYFLSAQSGNTGGLTWAEVSAGVTSDAQGNTVAGTGAGANFSGTSAEYNSLYGYNAGNDITTGNQNTCIGREAGPKITTANQNTLIGSYIGEKLTTGGRNTAIGSGIFSDLTTGTNNIGIGSAEVGKRLTTGYGNIFMGQEAGKVVTTGDNNIYLGFEAAKDATTGDNNICLGETSAPSSNTVSNEITLGNSSITKFRVPGINFSIKDSTATDNYVLTVDANGDAGWEAPAADLTALSASNLTSGTVPDARFPSTLPAASGANLTALNGSNISSGTVAAARVATLNQNTTGSAATLTTARTIAGTSFNGSANIDISYSNLTNKPTIPTNNNQLTNGAGYVTSAGIPASGGTFTGDITVSGGAGALSVSANSDIRLTSGSWSGDTAGKIQHHSNWLYMQGGSNGIIFRHTNGYNRWLIDSSGTFYPQYNNTHDIGTSSYRVRNLYVNDMHFSNEGKTNSVDGTWGDWTLQEGEETIFMINNRSGKRYKMALQEVV